MSDVTLEVSNKKSAVALSSVFAGLALTVMKLVVGVMTGSMGIISEAAHSALDLGAAIMTYFAVKIGDRPADDTHPYGHGKVESVSALLETGLLFITCFWIIYESVHRLIDKNVEVHATWYAFAVVIISIIIDISRSRALGKVAKETNSQALEADALHFSSDIWSSGVVLVGLIFVLFGVKGADTIAAIVVSMFVFVAGYRLGKRTIDALIDKAPAGIAEMVKEITVGAEGILNMSRLRVRALGPSTFIDMAVTVNRKLPLLRVEEIIKNLENKIKEKIVGADVVIHTQLGQLNDETIVESIQILSAKHSMSVHDIVVENLENKKYVSYDLEVPGHLTVRGAHDLAEHLEKEIKKELGDEVVLSAHIEPLFHQEILSENILPEELKRLEEIIKNLVNSAVPITEAHDILFRKMGHNLFVTLHCLVDGDVPLEVAHNASGRLEFLIKDKIPTVKRAIVHVEPR